MLIGLGATAVIIALLAFRPDKIFLDDTVDESLADAFQLTQEAEAPPADTPEIDEQRAQRPSPSSTASEQTIQPGDPMALASGEFVGVDHFAVGTATVYEQEGDVVLRLEDDTDIQNGPDLVVWLLPADSYDGGVPTEYLDLGAIKGNVGGQNYVLPAEFDPEVHQLVLVWCERFAVPFAAAALS